MSQPKKKVKTKTWSDVVKSLKSKDKLEIDNSDKSENEPETIDSVKWLGSDESNEGQSSQKGP